LVEWGEKIRVARQPIESNKAEFSFARGLGRLFELAGVLVRFDHVARLIVNVNQGIV
jgi:hypothetical protein